MKKLSILILTTSEGHFSIAEGLKDFLEKNNIDAKIQFYKESGLQFYSLIYIHTPAIFSSVFKMEKSPLIRFFLGKILLNEHSKKIHHLFEQEKPDVVLSTSFGFTSTITALRRKFSFKFINIIPNPRTFFLSDIALSADAHCVFDEHIQKIILRDFPHLNTMITGWFVRKNFEIPIEKSARRKELELHPDLKTLLFVSGSEGTNSVLKTIQKFIEKENLQLLIACGKNASLYEQLNTIKKTAKCHLVPFMFTPEIYKYMQASDLIIGKAGPNMLFEAVAAHTPFFATTHVGGLEDGNLDIIREYQIGEVEENPDYQFEKIVSLIEDTQRLEKITQSVKKLAEYNREKRASLLEYIASLT